jgi:hypothetical protein
LNPNAVALLTSRSYEVASKKHLTIYIVDSVSGSVLYKSSLPGAGLVEGVEPSILLCENWVAIGYYTYGPDAVQGIEFEFPEEVKTTSAKLEKKRRKSTREHPTAPNHKSWEITVLEMFESEKPDERDEKYGVFCCSWC